MRQPLQKGFTLIELLVVIAIVSILSSVVLASLSTARTKAYDAKVKEETNSIRLALEIYFAEHGGYPYPGDENARCIGASNCLVAGVDVNNPIAIGELSTNNLAAVFPTMNYSRTISTPDGDYRGYVYVPCESGEVDVVNNVCPHDKASIIIPSSLLIADIPVGSYVSSEYVPSVRITQVPGCMNSSATNYNPSATSDDGSCIVEIYGCTDPSAFNYNPSATINDGSCTPVVLGCNDSSANNHNPSANTNDGSCTYNPITGCTDSSALNYNPSAQYDDGSCYY